MLKKILMIIACLACSFSFANESATGTLYRLPSAANFDFNYPSNMAVPYASLGSTTPIKLQSRLQWYGSTGQEITTEQHAIVALVQSVDNRDLYNGLNQMLWSHGAGAYVSERGLEMELWFQQNNAANAYVWNQDNNRCVSDVQATVPANSLCLSDTPNSSGYLTPAPSFVLKKGIGYWVRVTITPIPSTGWATMLAELIEENSSGAVIVQTGFIAFQMATFFPSTTADIKSAVARTPGSVDEPYVFYAAFNYGY